MGGPVPLYPTPTRLALLGDVRDLLVADDGRGVPMLDYGDSDRPARVMADAMRQMARAGWVYQEPGHRLWQLTQRGLDVLEGRR